MIVGDGILAPDEKAVTFRLTAKELLENHRRRAFHLREDGGGLVAAEGEALDFTLPLVGSNPRPVGIAAVDGHVFAFDPVKKYVYWMKEDKTGHRYIYANTYEPYTLLHYYDKLGNETFFCVTEKDVLQYNGRNTVTVAVNKGGVAAAIYHERIFTAKGNTLLYSAPFDGKDWTESRYGAGRMELISEESGEILALQNYKDKLFLMRRHGITCLRALGDELNFKAVHLPMKCGALVAGSVALCGEHIAYFTDGGLYLFNGAASALAEYDRSDEIDFSQKVKAVSHCGRYYALVTRKEGGQAVYCYDPERREAHFIENGAADIASGDELYFTRGIYAYRLTERGVSDRFTPCLTAENIAFGPGGERMLREVAIEGEGSFTVMVTSNRGTRTVRGKANETLKLRSPLRGGNFAVKICFQPADADKARFRALLMRFTEDKDDD